MAKTSRFHHHHGESQMISTQVSSNDASKLKSCIRAVEEDEQLERNRLTP
jgi:hypothetical protein